MIRPQGLKNKLMGEILQATEARADFKLYTEGDELYQDMLASLMRARHTIRMESYLFAPDRIGWRFAEILAQCARRGVAVRLHLDAAGSLFWSTQKLERYLRRSGVRVRWFHRWSWRAPLRYNRRNHRKLLVIDQQQAYLGGFNIHEENSRELYGEQRWRDTHVRLTGRLVAQACALFDNFWKGRHRRWRSPELVVGGSILLPNHNRYYRLTLHSLYMDVFSRAMNSLYLTTPYFVPDRRTQAALMAAARRHVDVRILVPRKSDIWVTQWAAQAAYAALLESGVRIYEYLPRVLHAKTLVVDGSWCTIGTANVDYRSFFLNYELNLVSRDRALCHRLGTHFMNDLAESVEVCQHQWAQRRWYQQLRETVAWFARRWL